MREAIAKKILENKVIAVIDGIYGQTCLNLVSALNKGGIEFVAITFELGNGNECAEETVKLIKNQMGNKVVVGASNISNISALEIARCAGASFVISPDANDALILSTVDAGMVSIAGALTPTEIIFAYNCGADIVNVFPAGSMGPAYFTNIRNALRHIPMVAFGGINRNNVRLYQHAGVAGVCVDDCLYSMEQVENGDWEQISENTRLFLGTIC